MPFYPMEDSRTRLAETALEQLLIPQGLDNTARREAARRVGGLRDALSSAGAALLESALGRDEVLKALYTEETENADRALQSRRALRSHRTQRSHEEYTAARDRLVAMASEYGIQLQAAASPGRLEPRDSGGMPVSELGDIRAADTAKDALDRFLLPGELDHPNRRKAAVDLAKSAHELSRGDVGRLKDGLNSSTVLYEIYQDAQASIGRPRIYIPGLHEAAITEQSLPTERANPAASGGLRPVIPDVRMNRRRAPTRSEQFGNRIPPGAERRLGQERPTDEFRPGPPAPPTLLRQDAFHVPNGDRPATPSRMPPDRQLSDRRRDGGDRGV